MPTAATSRCSSRPYSAHRNRRESSGRSTICRPIASMSAALERSGSRCRRPLEPLSDPWRDPRNDRCPRLLRSLQTRELLLGRGEPPGKSGEAFITPPAIAPTRLSISCSSSATRVAERGSGLMRSASALQSAAQLRRLPPGCGGRTSHSPGCASQRGSAQRGWCWCKPRHSSGSRRHTLARPPSCNSRHTRRSAGIRTAGNATAGQRPVLCVGGRP